MMHMPPPVYRPNLQAENPGTETVDTPFEAAEGQEAAPKPTVSKDPLLAQGPVDTYGCC